MPDELRDPELEFLRAHWDAPPPGEGFHQRVRSAYDRDRAGRLQWRRWVAAAAVVAAGAALLLTVPPKPLARRYQPVSQPRFIVISQGEHP